MNESTEGALPNSPHKLSLLINLFTQHLLLTGVAIILNLGNIWWLVEIM
jgi:hypothetical protein